VVALLKLEQGKAKPWTCNCRATPYLAEATQLEAYPKDPHNQLTQ
jgi:hypothetical protein